MKLNVGDKIKFAAERERYTVQAASTRFAVCSRPFNLRRTTFYTIIDFEEKVRGPENLVFGHGAETREQMLARLTKSCNCPPSTAELHVECGCRTEVSYRNRIELDIERVYEAKEK